MKVLLPFADHLCEAQLSTTQRGLPTVFLNSMAHVAYASFSALFNSSLFSLPNNFTQGAVL